MSKGKELVGSHTKTSIQPGVARVVSGSALIESFHLTDFSDAPAAGCNTPTAITKKDAGPASDPGLQPEGYFGIEFFPRFTIGKNW